MREHLIKCFQNEIIEPFPKYKQNISALQSESSIYDGEWVVPRRSARIKSKSNKSNTENLFISRNKFESLSDENINITTSTNDIVDNVLPASVSNNYQTDKLFIIFNISKSKLTSAETKVLEKGLNFCPTTKDLDSKSLMNDLFSFCRKMRMREFFYKDATESLVNHTNILPNEILSDEVSERIDMSQRFKNPYYQPPHDRSKNLNDYLPSIKKLNY